MKEKATARRSRRRWSTIRAYLFPITAMLLILGIGFGLGRASGRGPEESDPLPTGDLVVQAEPAPVVELAEEVAPLYSEAELEMLALVIYQEAGGDACSDETRLMVGTVVMNRVADNRYPDTIYEVLTQRAQYGRLYWTGLVWPERASKEVEAHAVERAYKCAERILSGERFLPADVVFQAEFTQGTEVVVHQDGIYFCR